MNDNKEKFNDELKEFIKNNKNNKITNSVVDRNLYDTIYERFITGKHTNIKAITSIYKLCQYYLIACMISDNNLKRDIQDLVASIVNYKGLTIFNDMFSEVEPEIQDIKISKSSKINFKNGKFYVSDGNNEYEASVENVTEVEHFLLPHAIEGSRHCWKDIEHKCSAAPGSIYISVPWDIKANIKFDKNTGKYSLEDIKFYAEYNVNGLALVAKYKGINKTTWINEVPLNGQNEDTIENVDWDGTSIVKERVYICKYRQSIAYVKSDWDGYYHTLAFDQLRELLEKAAI